MGMGMARIDPASTALLLVDMQNDFIHPDGAYARGGAKSELIAALPARLAPVADAMRAAGGLVISTHFTLVAGPGGEPLISPHLKKLRPFLGAGDFAPGGFGHDLIEELKPADIRVEKVAFSAFYQSRLEFVLRRAGIERLIAGGIVTNGGVASTVRDAHVRDIETTVLADGSAAFRAETHDAAIADLASIAEIATCAEVIAALTGESLGSDPKLARPRR